MDAVLRHWVLERGEPEEREATVPETGEGPVEGDPEAFLDRSVLAGLRGLREEGEPDILGELIGLFLTDAPPRLVALREAAEAGDARSVERIAHTLKGSCGNMGAVGMAALCTELEGMGCSEKLAAVPVEISRLEEELERVRAVFERELAKK